MAYVAAVHGESVKAVAYRASTIARRSGMERSDLTAYTVAPVVYPAIAAKLGLLPATTVFWVLRFYYTLNAIDREIDDLIRDSSMASR